MGHGSIPESVSLEDRERETMNEVLKLGREAGRGSGFIWAAVCVIGIHLCLSLIWPHMSMITPSCWIVVYGLAIVVTLREASTVPSRTRWRWWLLATYFGLAIGTYLCILNLEVWHHTSQSTAWLNSLLRAYRGLPLLLAVCTPEEDDTRVNRVLDILQTALIAVIFFVLFTPQLEKSFGVAATPLPDLLVNRYIYTQAGILALLSLLAVVTAMAEDSRVFQRVLAIYLCVAVPASIWTNQVLIQTWSVASASPLFVLSDLTLLAYIIAVPLSRDTLKPRVPGPRMLFLRLGASVILPLLAVLASMLLAMAGHHAAMGLVFGVASLAIYGLRATYGQFKLVAAQVDLEHVNERLEMLSQRDPLTGLYNRRWFAEQFQLEWRRAQRGDQPISLLLLDVDHFKLYNDTRGHAQGDACLQAISTLFVDQLSSRGDALVRWGGEEFVVMLPATDMDGMRVVARRIEEALAAAQLPHPVSPFGVVTVSIGGVTWVRPDGATNPDNLVMRADAALYEAKARGRNRIHLVREPAALV
jgi:diguanylate cyclase (GGDEF)-like protein